MKKDCFRVKREVFVAFALGFILLSWSTSAFSQWTVETLPTISSNWALNDIFMVSDTEGWAVGWDQSNPANKTRRKL